MFCCDLVRLVLVEVVIRVVIPFALQLRSPLAICPYHIVWAQSRRGEIGFQLGATSAQLTSVAIVSVGTFPGILEKEVVRRIVWN